MNRKCKWWILFITSLLLLIFGLTISIVFYCVLRDSDYILADSAHKVSISETGNIGDFVGGVVGTVLSFASVILLILTLTSLFYGNIIVTLQRDTKCYCCTFMRI